jgi:PDZ domain
MRLGVCFALVTALVSLAAPGAMAAGPETASTTVAAHDRTLTHQAPSDTTGIQAGGDRTLVIPPSAAPEQPASGGQAAPNEQGASQPDIGSDNSPLPADLPPPRHATLPYLGVSVMYTVSTTGEQQMSGLKVMSVDPHSPAARAGLKPGTPATTIGATTQTAGQFLGPLDAALRPLLAKSGQLGTDGDLIVAIDDHRVTAASDLRDRLARLHPGDIIYLTVLRQQRDGSYETLKLPVTLGLPPGTRTADSAR